MVSINTSSSASSALRALQATSKAIETSQTRIATGYRVNSSSDNASAWTIAQSVRSDIAGTATIQENLKTALGRAKVASTGLDTVATILGEIKAKLIEANGASSSVKTSIQTQIASLQTQLKTTVSGATFDGTNLLNSTGSFTVTTGYSAATGMTTDTTTLTQILSSAGTAGTLGLATNSGTYVANTNSGKSIVNFDISATGANTLDGDITVVQAELNTAIAAISTYSGTLGSLTKRLEIQDSFLTTLNDVKSKALGTIIDADLDEEAARLSALQVSQQLATTALQIANQSRSNILQLFQ